MATATPGLFVGLSEPWDGTLATFFAPKSDAEVIKSAILYRIMTATDERVMIDFGTDFPKSPGEPNDDELMELLRRQITDAVNEDPRVQLVGVDALSEENSLVFQVRYQIKADPFRRPVDALRLRPRLTSTSSTS